MHVPEKKPKLSREEINWLRHRIGNPLQVVQSIGSLSRLEDEGLGDDLLKAVSDIHDTLKELEK